MQPPHAHRRSIMLSYWPPRHTFPQQPTPLTPSNAQLPPPQPPTPQTRRTRDITFDPPCHLKTAPQPSPPLQPLHLPPLFSPFVQFALAENATRPRNALPLSPGTNSLKPYAPGVTHQMCLVLWTWRKLADELMQRTHPRSVERLSRLEGYRQPSLSISRKVKTILMRRMNTSSL